MDVVAIYEDILQGKRKRFPSGTWQDKQNAVIIVKYLLEEKLKWSREEICEKLGYSTFKEVKLHGMIHHAYNHSPYDALNAVYPGRYQPWELRCAPQRF